MASLPEISKILTLLSASYPSFALKDATSDLYIRLLADLPAAALEAAALEHISRNAYFPTIAELRQRAFDLIEERPPEAQAAWQEVLTACAYYGRNRSPVFSHPLIAEAVGQMGWRSLCLSENAVADRAHFIPMYQELCERSRLNARRLPEVQALLANIPRIPLLKEA